MVHGPNSIFSALHPLSLLPRAANNVTNNPSLDKLLLVTLANLLIVLPHLGQAVVMRLLHGVERPTLREAGYLHETNRDVFPGVDIIVEYAEYPIPFRVEVFVDIVLVIAFDCWSGSGGGVDYDGCI